MYKIIFEKKALHFLKNIEKDTQNRIAKKINELYTNPRLGIPLIGNLSGLWKLRIGDYRVIYKIKDNELIIVVIKIGHRKNVYE